MILLAGRIWYMPDTGGVMNGTTVAPTNTSQITYNEITTQDRCGLFAPPACCRVRQLRLMNYEAVNITEFIPQVRTGFVTSSWNGIPAVGVR